MSDRLKKVMKLMFWGFVALLVYDGYLLYSGGSIDTISYGMWDYAQRYPMINSFLSMLIGHMFWTIKERDNK